MLYPSSVSLSNKATKQIQLNTETKLQQKATKICSEFLSFGDFSQALPRKQHLFIFTVCNIPQCYSNLKSINVTTLISR